MNFFCLIGRGVASVFWGVWRFMAACLNLIFGHIRWSPPFWLRGIGRFFAAIGNYMRRHVMVAASALVVLIMLAGAGGGGFYWYINQPKPYTVKVTVRAPEYTDYTEQPYRLSPLVVVFSDSVAPIEQVGKTIESGVSISPEVAGQWQWADQRTLVFSPEGDWPAGQAFTLNFAKQSLLTPGALLSEYSQKFSSKPFTISRVRSHLYEDPASPEQKKLISTVTATHPFDENSLQQHVVIKLSKGLRYSDFQKKTDPQVFFSKGGNEAYIHSAIVDVPLEPGTINLTLTDNIRAKIDGNNKAKGIQSSVVVPGRYQLQFLKGQISFVDNKRGEPEPILFITSNKSVDNDKIKDAVEAWKLPLTYDQNNRRRLWSEAQIDEKLLERSEKVALTHISSDQPQNTVHAFKLEVTPGYQLYVRVKADVESNGGYLSRGRTVVFSSPMPAYPKHLGFLSEGALLNLNGDKTLGLMARGIPQAQVEIARILPRQLHHLVNHLDAKFVRPEISETRFDEMVERSRFTVNLKNARPDQTEYASVNLSPYLDYRNGRRGIFVLRVSPSERQDKSTLGQRSETRDIRFIVVTDIGIIAKRTTDGGHDVFVQSISTGAPMANALVEVYGVNGMPVASEYSDEGGHVRFDDLSAYTREKRPLMYVVSNGDDQSFLPIADQGRLLDMSRFAIDGRREEGNTSVLRSYLFTERGLYRPGEMVHIGAIVRASDWSAGLSGVPVKLNVYDPRGELVDTASFSLDSKAFAAYDYQSNAAAPAGTYSAELVLGDDYNTRQSRYLGSVNFSVRDFEPDRMKVKASLYDGEVKGWIKPADVKAKVTAQHLFGASASERRVSMIMRLEPALPRFKGYSDYNFYLWKTLDDSMSEELADGKTDDKGEAVFDLNLGRFTATAYDVQILARVFEADGGRNVAADARQMVSSEDYMIGVKIPDSLSYVRKDAARIVEWIAVNPELQTIAADGLTRELVEVRYVSVLVKQNDGSYRYESRRKEEVIDSKPFSLGAGSEKDQLKTSEPGTYLVNIRKGEKILNTFTYNVVGDANVSRSLDRNAELQLSLNKQTYAPGEEIEISIRAPYTGAGLITIERDRVYQYEWFTADTTSSVQRIRLPHGLEGNAYINVQFVRSIASDEIYMTPLSYGVVPFSIDLDARRVGIALKTPKTIEPGQGAEIKVSLDRPSRIVVWGVDEGILQVARYQQPKPLEFFFSKRSLEVTTSQILDLILPEFSRLMAVAAVGGDEDSALAAHLNPFKRKNKAPVVWWSDVVDMPSGENTLTWQVPDYFNGQLHFFAVALDENHIGVTQSYTEVRAPVVLTPNLPAFVAPGDKFVVSSGVFSNLENAADIRISLKGDAGLKILNPEAQNFTIKPKSEATARFEIEAEGALGSRTLEFTAELPGGRIIKLSETLSIRPLSERRVLINTGLFDGQKEEIKPERKLYSAYRKVEVGAAGSPLVWTKGLSNYLENYQYSCTEQITSKAIPSIVFGSRNDGDAVRSIETMLSTLYQRQNGSGGFGVWAATPDSAPFVSLYAADMMLEARERGFSVPQSRITSSKSYLTGMAAKPAEEGIIGARYQAYAIFLLTRQGEVTGNQLTALRERLETYFKPEDWHSDLTAVYMAASYKMMKLDKEADALIDKQKWLLAGKWQTEYGYYDPLVHDAELLHILARYFPDKVGKISPDVIVNMGKAIDRRVYNSLSAAVTIRALDYYEKYNNSTMSLEISAVIDDVTNMPLIQSGRPQRASVPEATESLKFAKQGSGTAFYVLSEEGYDRAPPQEVINNGLEVFHEYLDLKGNPVTKVNVGQEFLVRVRVRATGDHGVDDVAVVDLLPGGIEPVYRQTPTSNPSCDESDDCENDSEDTTADFPVGEAAFSDWDPAFVDPRDDRVVIYGFVNKDVSTFTYKVRAVSSGIFNTPPPFAEALYSATTVGQGTTGKLEIVTP